jgi:glyoxylase-like metal-dependent hydrolase (beta-lactamase superfamily II)
MKYILPFIIGGFLILDGCRPKIYESQSWCLQTLRPALVALPEVPTQRPWFKVYRVAEGVYAIAEPYNFQEVISYLIVGSGKALLFDTGMGLDSISKVVKELTSLPITVINSHTHYDHIGGNREFETILAVDTPYTNKFSTEGWSHEIVKHEVAEDALCLQKLPKADTAGYSVNPYHDMISRFVKPGEIIDLGNKRIEILAAPGHTPDGLALLDREAGHLWTGDTFYEATIWLFFDGTDLDAYEKSIAGLASLAPNLKKVFPAHNTPIADPQRLIELKDAFAQIRSGKKKGVEQKDSQHPEDVKALIFEFDRFSFLIRKDYLSPQRNH